MARFAVIENETVTNIIEADAEFAQQIGAVPAGSWAIGDRYIDGKFVKPDVPAPDWPALIATRRWLAETSGTTFGGMPIDTGRDSQGLITGAALAAMLDPAYSVRWKTVAGFVDLTTQQIIGVASAVRTFVQASFDREAVLLGAVADGSITAEMLEEGWPA